MKYGLLASLTIFGCLSSGIWLGTLTPSWAVIFIPPEDNIAPVQSNGGAARSGLQFIPPPDNASPYRTVSGTSRDSGFIPPPDNPFPRRTASGASRDVEVISSSPSENVSDMLAVTPSNFYGLTVSARPTIMAYLPATNAHTAIFSLKDQTQAVIYQHSIPLHGVEGILAINLPEHAPELIVGEYYHWFVTLQTDEYITPDSPYVDAWVKRVEPTAVMVKAMGTPDGLAKAKLFAQSGIWYDAAAQLASLQIPAFSDGDTVTSWHEFLTSVGLDSLVHSSFL